MTDELIAQISEQLAEHMRQLSDAVDDVESQIRNREVPAERLEVTVQRSAAGVIAAVGALRALTEVEAEEEEAQGAEDE